MTPTKRKPRVLARKNDGPTADATAHDESFEAVPRDDELIGTASSHVPKGDRRAEEPSEAAPEGERLEGSL